MHGTGIKIKKAETSYLKNVYMFCKTVLINNYFNIIYIYSILIILICILLFI